MYTQFMVTPAEVGFGDDFLSSIINTNYHPEVFNNVTFWWSSKYFVKKCSNFSDLYPVIKCLRKTCFSIAIYLYYTSMPKVNIRLSSTPFMILKLLSPHTVTFFFF